MLFVVFSYYLKFLGNVKVEGEEGCAAWIQEEEEVLVAVFGVVCVCEKAQGVYEYRIRVFWIFPP